MKLILLSSRPTAGFVSFVSIQPRRNGVAVYNCDPEGRHVPLLNPTDATEPALLDTIEDWGTTFAYESERRLACAVLALQKWGIV